MQGLLTRRRSARPGILPPLTSRSSGLARQFLSRAARLHRLIHPHPHPWCRPTARISRAPSPSV
jgi:hypothetical protein